MKRQPTRMGDIFANVVNDKGLTSKIYKTTITPQQQQQNQSKKMGRRPKYIVLQRRNIAGR